MRVHVNMLAAVSGVEERMQACIGLLSSIQALMKYWHIPRSRVKCIHHWLAVHTSKGESGERGRCYGDSCAMLSIRVLVVHDVLKAFLALVMEKSEENVAWKHSAIWTLLASTCHGTNTRIYIHIIQIMFPCVFQTTFKLHVPKRSIKNTKNGFEMFKTPSFPENHY